MLDETGVYALAVAIGSAHGFYQEEPKPDLERLSQIQAAPEAVLVLQGGSGIPGSSSGSDKKGYWQNQFSYGIKVVFMASLKECLLKNDEIDLRRVFHPATKAVTARVKEKLEIIKAKPEFINS